LLYRDYKIFLRLVVKNFIKLSLMEFCLNF